MRDINNNLKSNFKSSININKKSVAKIHKTLYDGRMRRVPVFFLLLVPALFFIKAFVFAVEKPSCTATVDPSQGVTGETRFSISGNVNSFPPNAEAEISIIDTKKTFAVQTFPMSLTLDNINSGQFGPIDLDPFYLPGDYKANVYYVFSTRGKTRRFLCSSNAFTVNPSLTPTEYQCKPLGRDPEDQSKCLDSRCTPTGKYQCLLNAIDPPLSPSPTPISSLPPCAQWALLDGTTISPKDPRYNNPDFKDRKCIAVGTAIGNISTQPQGFVRRIFSLVLGIAGGIALILIIISGYRMMASQGNPEAIQAARDQLISAIVGLLFIIFSFVILQVIGVDILKIPGFNP